MATQNVKRRSVRITLGDLVAAAFDAVGGEVTKASRVLGSDALAQAAHRRIVVT